MVSSAFHSTKAVVSQVGPKTTCLDGHLVWGDSWSSDNGQKNNGRYTAVACILVAVLGSPKSVVCCHESAFSCPCIQPSVLLSTRCAGSVCSMYNTTCVSLSLLSQFLCCACVCTLIDCTLSSELLCSWICYC